MSGGSVALRVFAPDVVTYQVIAPRSMQLFVALNGAQFTHGIDFMYTSVDMPTLLDVTPTHVPRTAGSQVTLTGDAFVNGAETGVCTLERCLAVDDTGAKIACATGAKLAGPHPSSQELGKVGQTTNTQAVCIMPDLSGESAAAVVLKVKVGSAESSEFVLPLYNLSAISSVAPTSGPANGRASIVLKGENLKSADASDQSVAKVRINGRESANGKLTFEPHGATLTAQSGAFANGFATLSVGPQNISFTRNGADWSAPTNSSRFVIFSVGNVQPYPYPYP